jgi:hypothetical protein
LQNIDPILFLQPVLTIAMSVGVILYWRHRSGFRGIAFALGFAAYSIAIAGKVMFQTFTYSPFLSTFGSMSVELGLYFGLQTVILEVGLAYLFAVYGVKHGGFKQKDGVAYGISLAFWENGALIGGVSLLNLALVYFLLATNSSAAQALYSTLSTSQPAYFLAPSALMPSTLLGTLERLSSLLIHVAWGVLCVLAALTGRRRYLAYALPMGLVDATVPFASLNVGLFEFGLFLLSILFVLIAWQSFRREDQQKGEGDGLDQARRGYD